MMAQYNGLQSGTSAEGGAETQATIVTPADATLQEFCYPGGVNRPFDSGAPVMLLISGQLALMTNWEHIGGNGPDDAAYLTGIQSAITANATFLGITAHTISTVDLSGFRNYAG